MPQEHKLLSEPELASYVTLYVTEVRMTGSIEDVKQLETRLIDLIQSQKIAHANMVIETKKDIYLTHSGKDFEEGYLKGREDLREEQRERNV